MYPNDVAISKENINQQLEILRLIEHHKWIADKQRLFYNDLITNPNNYFDAIMIECDFKQKITYGNLIKS